MGNLVHTFGHKWVHKSRPRIEVQDWSQFRVAWKRKSIFLDTGIDTAYTKSRIGMIRFYEQWQNKDSHYSNICGVTIVSLLSIGERNLCFCSSVFFLLKECTCPLPLHVQGCLNQHRQRRHYWGCYWNISIRLPTRFHTRTDRALCCSWTGCLRFNDFSCRTSEPVKDIRQCTTVAYECRQHKPRQTRLTQE